MIVRMILAKNNKLSKFVEVTSIGPFFRTRSMCMAYVCGRENGRRLLILEREA